MFRFLAALFLICQTINSNGQENNHLDEFVYIDTLPEFPGGDRNLMKTIKQNICYPINAIVDSISGIVVCKFVIDTFGNATKIEVIEGIREDLNAEAKRIVGLLNGWSPCIHNGKKEQIYHQVKVEFVLNRKNIKKALKLNKT